MKILFIIPDYSGTGGAETVINIVCSELKKRNINYYIYIAAKQRIKKNETRNLSWLDGIDYSRENFNLKIKKLNDYCHSLKIKKIILKNKINSIITVDGRGISLAKAAIKKSDKKVMLFSWGHTTTQKIKVNTLLKSADHHITISGKISDQLESLGIDQKKITTIYNPVYPQEKTIPFSSKNFLFIGRLRETPKQVSTILSALSEIDTDWTLHVIGDGPDSEKYKSQAKKLKIDKKIIFHGFIENPWDYIQKNIEGIGALLLSSKAEGFPMVLCEAMSYGIYCISSDCETGPSEIIKKGINGQLFGVGDYKSLSLYIEDIIKNKASIDHALIKKSIEHLHVENYMKNFIQAIKKPTEKKK